MGVSAAAVVVHVGRAASGPVGLAALCGLCQVLLEVLLERQWPCDWVTEQHTSGWVEDVDVAVNVMAAVGGDAAVLHSLGQLLSGYEPLDLEIGVAHQGNHPHQLPNRHWVGGPAGVEEYLQVSPGSSLVTWKVGKHTIPEMEVVNAVAAASADPLSGSELNA